MRKLGGGGCGGCDATGCPWVSHGAAAAIAIAVVSRCGAGLRLRAERIVASRETFAFHRDAVRRPGRPDSDDSNNLMAVVHATSHYTRTKPYDIMVLQGRLAVDN